MPVHRLTARKPTKPSPWTKPGALAGSPKPLPGPIAGATKIDIRRTSVRGELRKFLASIDALPELNFQQMPRPNVIFDYFHSGSDEVTQGPTQRAIPGHLIAAFAAGQEANEADPRYQWTHVLLAPKEKVTDPLRKVKDCFPDLAYGSDFPPSGRGPRVYIAPKLGPGGESATAQAQMEDGIPVWWIILVERQHRGTGREFRRIYLRRDEGREL